jgi:hypothetical protein
MPANSPVSMSHNATPVQDPCLAMVRMCVCSDETLTMMTPRLVLLATAVLLASVSFADVSTTSSGELEHD